LCKYFNDVKRVWFIKEFTVFNIINYIVVHLKYKLIQIGEIILSAAGNSAVLAAYDIIYA
jgi:hypothetical protein